MGVKRDLVRENMVSKIKYRNLTEPQKKEYLRDFYSIISTLRGYDEAKNFFKDLLTTSEIVMICRRIQIAKLLMKGWTYERVKEKLGVGATTISQVDKWLNEGFGGYARVLKRHNANKDKQREKIPSAQYSLEQVRRRYPAQFALLNLLMDKRKK